MITLDKCDGIFNTLSKMYDKTCVSKKQKM